MTVGILLYYYFYPKIAVTTANPTPTMTHTATLERISSETPNPIPSEIFVTTSPTASKTAIATLSPTDTRLPSPTFTETTSPTPQENFLGNGFINKALVSVWEEPNKTKVATLGLNQPVLLLKLEFVSGSNWYKCRWDDSGVSREGWILAEYITLGSP